MKKVSIKFREMDFLLDEVCCLVVRKFVAALAADFYTKSSISIY